MKVGERTITNEKNQGQGLFLMVLDSIGNCRRLENLGWTSDIELNSIVESGDHYLISGSFSEKILIGKTELESEGNADAFLAAFDKQFKLVWVQKIGGSRKEHAAGLLSCSDGVILSGSFLSKLEINNSSISPENNNNDIFLTKIDASGKIKWFRKFGGPGNEYPKKIVINNKGDIFLVGQFKDSLFSPTRIISTGNEDVFLVKLVNCDEIKLPLNSPQYKCPEKEILLEAGPNFITYDWDNGKSCNSSYLIEIEKEVSLTLTSKNGCIVFDTISVINSPFESPFIGKDTSITDTSFFVLKSATAHNSYLWSNDSTTPYILIKGNELNEGANHVWLKTSNEHGCEGYDEIVIDVNKTPDHFYTQNFIYSIYPNPANDYVNIAFNNSLRKVKIGLYDISGKEILLNTHYEYVKDQIIRLNISAFTHGVYTLLISTPGLIITSKIVHQ